MSFYAHGMRAQARHRYIDKSQIGKQGLDEHAPIFNPDTLMQQISIARAFVS
jgi:hypothetical protein